LETDKIKNIAVKINGEIVGGCVDFKTNVTTTSRELGEYLCSQSYAVIESSKIYEITLKLIANHIDYSNEELFTLEIKGNNFVITYNNCSVLKDREYGEQGVFYREIVITAGERIVTYE
jgi:hypothetical protein